MAQEFKDFAASFKTPHIPVCRTIRTYLETFCQTTPNVHLQVIEVYDKASKLYTRTYAITLGGAAFLRPFQVRFDVKCEQVLLATPGIKEGVIGDALSNHPIKPKGEYPWTDISKMSVEERKTLIQQHITDLNDEFRVLYCRAQDVYIPIERDPGV